jgi:heme oxygenase
LILAGGQNRAARLADYHLELERLTDEIVELNLPLAEIFSSGAAPNEDLVASTRERLRAVQEDLAALGSPPHELAESRAAFVEATDFYAQAGGHLAENLAKAQPGSPFDQEFLTAAMHGG